MKVIREQKVAVSDLKANLFVRQSLNEDHVEYLMGLVASGKEIDPIEVIEDLSIVDGRHRRWTYEMCDVKETVVKVLRFDNEAEMIAYAFRKNCTGTMTPSMGDIDHTIESLLERKQSNKAIAEGLALPLPMVRQRIQQVNERLSRAKLLRAAAAITDGGLTVKAATEQYGVDIDKLKEHLSGRRKKAGNGISELQRSLTFNYRSIGQKNANAFRKLTEQYDDGDVTEKQVWEILSHLKDLQRKSTRNLADWETRWIAKFGGNNGKSSEAATA